MARGATRPRSSTSPFGASRRRTAPSTSARAGPSSSTAEAGFTRTGVGLFAACVLKQCGHLAIIDEEHLEHDRMRERWLTQLFTQAAFRPVRKSHSPKRLRAFHKQHWLLLEALQQRLTYNLDRDLARAEAEANPCATIEQYESVLRRILAVAPRRTSALKPFRHAFYHYVRYLSEEDIARFQNQVESYRLGDLALSELRKTVQVWAVRYDKRFTRQDAAFRPYPGPLAGA